MIKFLRLIAKDLTNIYRPEPKTYEVRTADGIVTITDAEVDYLADESLKRNNPEYRRFAERMPKVG